MSCSAQTVKTFAKLLLPATYIAKMVADMEVDKVAGMVADMEVDSKPEGPNIGPCPRSGVRGPGHS